MAQLQPLTPSERDRAVDRLRRWTVGAAIGGVGAVGVIGYVAAQTLPGNSNPGSAAAPAGQLGSDLGGTVSNPGSGYGLVPGDSGLVGPVQPPSRGGFGGGVANTGGS